MGAETFLYVGCGNNDSATSIRFFRTGNDGLEVVGELSGIDNPSFLALHPGAPILYAVSETVDGNGTGGGVVAMAVDQADGSLSLQQELASGGDAPCHLSVNSTADRLCVANYVSGSVTAFRLHRDGRIGDVAYTHQPAGTGGSGRQEGPHAHCAVPHPHRPGFLVADLGHDRITHYGPGGVIEQQIQLAPGSGPRHLAWHPTLPLFFVVGELNNTVTVVQFDTETGAFTATGAVSTVPLRFTEPSLAAEVRVNADGSRVYVSNRGHDSIAVFEFSNGTLQVLAHVPSGGRSPRHFALAPTGDWMVVANQESDSMERFLIDPGSGVPIPTDETDEVPHPLCVTFLAVGP